MGFHEVSRVLGTSKATGYERLAIVALAHRVKDERGDGAAWPGIDTFAADVNCSERFIQKIVKGWKLAPHEVYVIEGGGRYNPNRYIILAGCAFAEVVRRLMVNLNITEQQAEKIANDCGYQKGEHYDMSAAATTGKGEHYDTERVNITTPKGEHYAERVNTSAPEQEDNINLEPQLIEPQIFSSSPTAAATPSAVEEKEKIETPLPALTEIEVLEKAYSDLCGVWEGSSKSVKAQIKSNLTLLLSRTPALAADDFEDFKRYYEAVTAQKPHPTKPTPNFVTGGWEQFLAWQGHYLAETVRGYLPGIEKSLALSRGAWRDFERAAVGDEFRIAQGWQANIYRKMADDLWLDVPTEQWPDWARESA